MAGLSVAFILVVVLLFLCNRKVREGISGHGPSFRSLAAVFANNGTASESSKVQSNRHCTGSQYVPV